ncbi:MAG TPA: AbrB/MazE/SpoVT family DNA-binding domain-containing protein [Dehalococcoidia bacterium]|nr:AbrB/MazE/SpoVT family DNA-binding domain-containing protein [Dehalococcoidia bacterium]
MTPSSASTKGQVTIPAQIRRLLGIAPHDKLAFVVEAGSVQAMRPGGVVEQPAGPAGARNRRSQQGTRWRRLFWMPTPCCALEPLCIALPVSHPRRQKSVEPGQGAR